jgi:hypothetical protein
VDGLLQAPHELRGIYDRVGRRVSAHQRTPTRNSNGAVPPSNILSIAWTHPAGWRAESQKAQSSVGFRVAPAVPRPVPAADAGARVPPRPRLRWRRRRRRWTSLRQGSAHNPLRRWQGWTRGRAGRWRRHRRETSQGSPWWIYRDIAETSRLLSIIKLVKLG